MAFFLQFVNRKSDQECLRSLILECLLEPRRDKTSKVTVRPAKTQISLGIRPVWSESSLCTQWVAKVPSFLHVDSEDSDLCADAQADLSLRWAHMPYCWFCHEAAHILNQQSTPVAKVHLNAFFRSCQGRPAGHVENVFSYTVSMPNQ